MVTWRSPSNRSGTKRGVWIEGKITDKVTGQPLQGGVEYVPLYSNPNRLDYPGVYAVLFHFGTVKEDGSYRVVGLPGPGMPGTCAGATAAPSRGSTRPRGSTR